MTDQEKYPAATYDPGEPDYFPEGEYSHAEGLVICSVCRSRPVLPEREICAECKAELDGDTSDVGTP